MRKTTTSRTKSKTSRAKRPPAKSRVRKAGKSKGFSERKNTLKLSGAMKWLLPTLESAYTPLVAKDTPHPGANQMKMTSINTTGAAVLAAPDRDVWRRAMLDYKQRKAAAIPALAQLHGAAFVPGTRNWQPLGPSVVLNGQTGGNEPVAGRIAGLAIAPNASVVYAASANGGVFASRDGGTTWRSLMDRFDLQPTNFASASLVCGAIALDLAEPNRVYVGTGEGDTYQLFDQRIANALPAYRGVGPIRSDDGGATWIAEESTPDLAGEAFFALAVDPTNRENVIAGTTAGLYRRVSAGGQIRWTRLKPGVFASVVVASAGGVTRFYAAEWGQGGMPSMVYHSDDHGASWSATGTGFPVNDVGRIALGVQPANPTLVYAFAATRADGLLHGLYRLDAVASAWKSVSGLPDVLPANNGSSQGDYDLAIAVDAADGANVYLGGSYADVNPYPASVWRCVIRSSGAAYRTQSATSIGTHAHSDVHVLVHTPGDPNELWCGCDGGVFLNRDAKGSGQFAGMNNGLSCLCSNFIGQHPTDPGIIFTGLQDNGTAWTSGSPGWKHVLGGDGGYCLVNWANPKLVIAYTNGTLYRTSTGALQDDWTQISTFPWSTMTQPLVSAPYTPSVPANAGVIALGVGRNVMISPNFGTSWPAQFSIPTQDPNSRVFALAFASTRRLFAATMTGEVYRADLSAGNWTVARLDLAHAGPLGVTGLINDIEVDWSDGTFNSVYVTFAGMSRPGQPLSDNRRVWRFDGTRWQDRSGSTAATHLLNVEHNALVVDPQAPGNVYVGADIGVWHSTDSGLNWAPVENGLPESPVFDLQIHPTQRLLRAALHGRGVYEMPLN